MTKILELSERECIIIMINVLRVVIENIDNMQEWISNASREMETKKNQKEMLKI